MKNMRRIITMCAMLIGLAAMLPSQAQTFTGTVPETGKTYYLWNVGQEAFLSSDDSLLTIGGQPIAVTVEADSHDTSSSYVFLSTAGGRLSSSLFEQPRSDGKGKYDQWLLERTSDTGFDYTLANRYRESSSFYLVYSSLLEFVAMSPLKPANIFVGGQWRFVEVANATQTVTLDEQSDTYTQPVLSEGVAAATVQLRRTLTSDSWNSFCVPFDIPSSQVKAQFGDDAVVAEFTGVDATTLHFTPTDHVTAGQPCLLYATQAPTDATIGYVFTGVTAFAATPDAVVQTAEAVHGGATVTLSGSFVKTTVPTAAYVLRRNKIYHLTSDMAMKGFRAYFTETTSGGSKITEWSLDGNAPTSIDGIDAAEGDGFGVVYNLQGQVVSRQGLGVLPKGVYVVKGKKVIK